MLYVLHFLDMKIVVLQSCWQSTLQKTRFKLFMKHSFSCHTHIHAYVNRCNELWCVYYIWDLFLSPLPSTHPLEDPIALSISASDIVVLLGAPYAYVRPVLLLCIYRYHCDNTKCSTFSTKLERLLANELQIDFRSFECSAKIFENVCHTVQTYKSTRSVHVLLVYMAECTLGTIHIPFGNAPKMTHLARKTLSK